MPKKNRYNTLCREFNDTERLRDHYRKQVEKASQERLEALNRIIRAAEAEGLTYGQYVSREYIRAQKEAEQRDKKGS